MKETLLEWHGSFVGRKRLKMWKVALYTFFGQFWKERDIIVFENEDFSIQRLKNYFVCRLWNWYKVVDSLPLFNFFFLLLCWVDSR